MSEHTEYLDWLASIKPGDRVLTTRGYGRGYDSTMVAKVTATQLVLDGGSRYRRKDGRSVGGDADRIAKAAAAHEAYRQACLSADAMQIPQHS